MAIVDSIKPILSVKFKPRHDSYSDQYSRIFMMKMMLVAALLIGLNWSTDKINCVNPDSIKAKDGFVGAACWINGFYVYEKIRYHVDELGYFGMPREIKYDGMFPDGTLCSTDDKKLEGRSSSYGKCEPMEKTFFLQYQYMTFVMAVFALVYYAPYAVFKWINVDMVSLKGLIKDEKVDDIVRHYFNHRVNSAFKMRMRILGNIIVKILYIVCNVVTFLALDGILNGNFVSYGSMWINWAKLDNQMAYDYMGMRLSPKPGNALLPTFGFCEIHESAKDIKTQYINKFKFICEISQFVLYQYVFIVIWFAMVGGIVFSIIGLLTKLIDHLTVITCFLKGGTHARRMYSTLTLREYEYLEYMRRMNIPLYNEVVAALRGETKQGLMAKDHNDRLPNYQDVNSSSC